MTRVILILLAALTGSTALVVTKSMEEAGLRREMAGRAACIAAIGGTDPQAAATACPEGSSAIAADHAARASRRCDQALLGGDLLGVDLACTTEVKTLLAQRQAESARADSLSAALDRTRADQAAAITRAEQRARTQIERTHRGQNAVSAAPRDAAGLVVCDAQCLRDRLGGPD